VGFDGGGLAACLNRLAFLRRRPLRLLCQAQLSRSSVMWHKSCLSSPRSTFLTISTLIGAHLNAYLFAIAHDIH